MKKIRLVLATLAFMTAGVAVFATELAPKLLTVYYFENSAGVDCALTADITCTGSGQPCMYTGPALEGGGQQITNKQAHTSNCDPVEKD